MKTHEQQHKLSIFSGRMRALAYTGKWHKIALNHAVLPEIPHYKTFTMEYSR